MRIYSVSPINCNLNFESKPKLSPSTIADMAVFGHHIYEYKKGIRNLFLKTTKMQNKDIIESRLNKENIAYTIHELPNKNNINVYFGAAECVDVVKSFKETNLKNLTAEQDFILGTMLGYSPIEECKRYLRILKGEIKLNSEGRDK